jgi:DeoR/GlpR family transcriptional regulator of sugar metabolism
VEQPLPAERHRRILELLRERQAVRVSTLGVSESADHTKIGTIADFLIASIDRITALVTGGGIDEGYRDELTRLGVEVVVAEESVPATAGRTRG